MDITFGATQLATKGVNGAYALSLNGQQINDEGAFFRAASVVPIARGNRSTDFSFNVTRTFNTVVDCEVFILTHFADISQQADLLCACNGVGDAATQDCVLSDAVLSSLRFSENRGLSVVVQYSFKGGLFVNEDVPDPPDGEDTLKAGTESLSLTDESKAVTFSIPFGSTPTAVMAIIHAPSGGFVIAVDVDRSTVSASGFTSRFGAAIPATGYFLSWIAVL